MSRRPLRIAVIAPIRYPIAEPHAGGLESSVWNQVRALRARGHEVTLCAVEGSDFLEDGPNAFVLPAVRWDDPAEATDTTYPVGYLERALPALDHALDHLRRHSDRFDIVDNHCLHGMPLTWTDRLPMPMVSTLHTPALPELLDGHAAGTRKSTFLAVSTHTRDEWRREGIEATVVPNGVDTDQWTFGPGGDDLVWTGRIVPEKGPHLALEAARLAGRRIVLAGRIGDVNYFSSRVEPMLGPDAEYAGVLDQAELARLVGRSACALVTPVWEEPFGLVLAEALATGTPVATFATGGVPEVIGGLPGTALVPVGDATSLARAAARLADESRPRQVRRRIRDAAIARFSLWVRMEQLEAIYEGLLQHNEPPLEDARDRALESA